MIFHLTLISLFQLVIITVSSDGSQSLPRITMEHLLSPYDQ